MINTHGKEIYSTNVVTKKKYWPVFAKLMENQFIHGGPKYSLPGQDDREATDAVCEMSPGKSGFDWIFQTQAKYGFRYMNFGREKDLLKIAAFAFIGWLKGGHHLEEEHDEDTEKDGKGSVSLPAGCLREGTTTLPEPLTEWEIESEQGEWTDTEDVVGEEAQDLLDCLSTKQSEELISLLASERAKGYAEGSSDAKEDTKDLKVSESHSALNTDQITDTIEKEISKTVGAARKEEFNKLWNGGYPADPGGAPAEELIMEEEFSPAWWPDYVDRIKNR